MARPGVENKNYPPGQHGPKGSRRKLSDYALALAEKQKLRYQYERQFRRYFQLALSKRGVTGEILLQLLETRLDNVVRSLVRQKTPARRPADGLAWPRHRQRPEDQYFVDECQGRRQGRGEVERSLAAPRRQGGRSNFSHLDPDDDGHCEMVSVARWRVSQPRTSTRSSTNSSSWNCIRARGVEAFPIERATPARRAFVLVPLLSFLTIPLNSSRICRRLKILLPPLMKRPPRCGQRTSIWPSNKLKRTTAAKRFADSAMRRSRPLKLSPPETS